MEPLGRAHRPDGYPTDRCGAGAGGSHRTAARRAPLRAGADEPAGAGPGNRLAGYGACAQVDGNLREWDYGGYEGRTTAEIRRERPDWSLWRDCVPEGETLAQVAERAVRTIARVEPVLAREDVLLFAHGHLLRILAARWAKLAPEEGARLVLGTAALSSLGYERETRAITRWNLSASE